MLGSLQQALPIIMKAGTSDSSELASRFYRPSQQEQSFDFFGFNRPSPGAFDNVKSTTEARMNFERLQRQEAIVMLPDRAVKITTPTIPTKIDQKKLTEIENEYARRLLTPLSQIEREQKGSHLILVASVPPLARRVLVPGTNEVKPFTLSTGDFDTDILSCLYHFHYCLLSHFSALLGKKKSENYLRDKKLKQLIDAGLVETSQLARSTAGRPATVYYLSASGLKQITDTLDLPVPIQPGARKHLFLEHSLDCTDVLLAGLELQHGEKANTVLDLIHERTLKASPLQVGSHRFVVPDGFLRLHANKPFGVGDELGILSEIDRNSEGREKWQQNIEAYTLISPD